MRKRLSPRGVGPATAPSLGRNCCAASKISIPTGLSEGTSSRQASTTTIESTTLSSCSSCPMDPPTPFLEQQEGPKVCAAPTKCPCECGRGSKRVTRSESFLPALRHRAARAGTPQHYSGRVGGVKKAGKN